MKEFLKEAFFEVILPALTVGVAVWPVLTVGEAVGL